MEGIPFLKIALCGVPSKLLSKQNRALIAAIGNEKCSMRWTGTLQKTPPIT